MNTAPARHPACTRNTFRSWRLAGALAFAFGGCIASGAVAFIINGHHALPR